MLSVRAMKPHRAKIPRSRSHLSSASRISSLVSMTLYRPSDSGIRRNPSRIARTSNASPVRGKTTTTPAMAASNDSTRLDTVAHPGEVSTWSAPTMLAAPIRMVARCCIAESRVTYEENSASSSLDTTSRWRSSPSSSFPEGTSDTICYLFFVGRGFCFFGSGRGAVSRPECPKLPLSFPPFWTGRFQPSLLSGSGFSAMGASQLEPRSTARRRLA